MGAATEKNAEPTVRFARTDDIPALLRLLVQVNMVHHNGRPDLFKGPATKYSADDLTAMLNDGDRPVFVCERDGAVLGYAMCVLQTTKDDPILTDRTALYVDDLCVDEIARGGRVGRRLFERVVAYAKEKGCYHVTLNVWACNPAARGFYEHLGMKPLKTGMEWIV